MSILTPLCVIGHSYSPNTRSEFVAIIVISLDPRSYFHFATSPTRNYRVPRVPSISQAPLKVHRKVTFHYVLAKSIYAVAFSRGEKRRQTREGRPRTSVSRSEVSLLQGGKLGAEHPLLGFIQIRRGVPARTFPFLANSRRENSRGSSLTGEALFVLGNSTFPSLVYSGYKGSYRDPRCRRGGLGMET